MTVSVEYLEELAVKIQLKNQIAKQKEEFNFISILADLSKKHNKKDVYAMEVSSELSKFINADGVILSQKVNNVWKNITYDLKEGIEDFESSEIERLYNLYTESDKSYIYEEENNILYIADENYGFINSVLISLPMLLHIFSTSLHNLSIASQVLFGHPTTYITFAFLPFGCLAYRILHKDADDAGSPLLT